MKKLLSILAIFVLMLHAGVYAEDIEVQPVMRMSTNSQDRVWVATFQLVWNEFMDDIVHRNITFPDGTPNTAKILNLQEFDESDISDKSYYLTVEKVKKNTKAKIAKAIYKKFKETSDILDLFDFTPERNKYIIYAMLKKDFEFTNAFDKLGEHRFGEDMYAAYFGISSKSDEELDKGVKVLYYNSRDDFAVVLTTKDDEEVYLCKNDSNKPFTDIYKEMFKKEELYKGDKEFLEQDELRVPDIKFNVEKVFNEFSNKRVKGTKIVIDKALESIKFSMNNEGVELKSEAGMQIRMTSLAPNDVKAPRYFYFDDTFVIFLKESGDKPPYFALRVHDISKFQ